MSEKETIAYVYTDTGALAGRVTMDDDLGAPCMYEGPHEYYPGLTDGLMTIRTVWVGHGVSSDYYETSERSELDAVWERIWEGENAEGIGQYVRTDDEAVELFKRYLRVFRPLVAVHDAWITTGYSKGDSVRLIGWSDVPRATYLEAARDHELIESAFKFIGEFVRGQFVVVAYEFATLSDATVDNGDVFTANVEWSELDRVHEVQYSDEFNPAPEALEYALSFMHIPKGLSVEPTFQHARLVGRSNFKPCV